MSGSIPPSQGGETGSTPVSRSDYSFILFVLLVDMKLTLVAKKEVAKDTKTFRFTPEAAINFIPGQSFDYTLSDIKYPDKQGSIRTFSISNSPTEGDFIEFTTRMRSESSFKKTLDEKEMGFQIEAKGPSGQFILDENNLSERVFLAGGIGITPFRSMIKYIFDKNLNIPIHLIYSNTNPEEIAFRQEFEEIAEKSEFLKLHMTITHPEESNEKWVGNTGRMDENLIRKVVKDISKPTFWIAGPPAMVGGMQILLINLGIPEDKIKYEKFDGY